MYEKIKKFYDLGLWDIMRVRNAVTKGFITPDQFETITKQKYE